MVPKAIVIEFSTRVVEDTGKVSDKTVFKLTPDVPGYLEWTSPSTLTFTPRSGFQFATTYAAKLEAAGCDLLFAPPASAMSSRTTAPWR